MELSHLDGKRIAVVLQGNTTIVVRGQARYVVDKDLGNCLRVDLSGTPGNPRFFIPESAKHYEVKPDRQHGCDYTVTVNVESADSASPPNGGD